MVIEIEPEVAELVTDPIETGLLEKNPFTSLKYAVNTLSEA